MSSFIAFDRINVGCGYDQRREYLNVDMDPACKPDLLLKDNDFSVLPKRHFVEVFANDVLEHIPRAQTMSALLEWADLLKLGGRIMIKTSSILGVARMLERQPSFVSHHAYSICLFGNQAHAGDFHHTGFTDQTLKTYILSADSGSTASRCAMNGSITSRPPALRTGPRCSTRMRGRTTATSCWPRTTERWSASPRSRSCRYTFASWPAASRGATCSRSCTPRWSAMS